MLTQKYIERSHRSNISSSKSGLFTLVFNVIIFVNALALNVNKRVSANMNVTALSPHQSSTSSFHCCCSIFRRRASGLTGQLDLHRDSFTSALTIGQCVEAQRILFLKPLFEGNTARVSLLKLQRPCRSAVCGFCQGTRSVWDQVLW